MIKLQTQCNAGHTTSCLTFPIPAFTNRLEPPEYNPVCGYMRMPWSKLPTVQAIGFCQRAESWMLGSVVFPPAGGKKAWPSARTEPVC